MQLDLTDEQAAALLALLNRTIETDRYPFPPHAVKIAAQRSVALLPPRRLTRRPGSPKRLSHRIAAGGPGGSEMLLRSRCADFCVCCGRPRFQSLIEPHCQRDPTAFWVNLQHLNTNDI